MQTARVGEPTMTDPAPTSAPEFMKHAGEVLKGADSSTKSVAIEQAGTGAPPPNQPAPRSDSQVDQNAAPPQDNSIPELPINNQQQAPAATEDNATQPAPAATQGGSDPAPTLPPSQVNDINNGSTSSSAATSSQTPTDNDATSSSKKKKKSGLSKLNPF